MTAQKHDSGMTPLAQRLREAMVRRKISQKEAANIAGVSDKTIQRVLNGADPTPRVLGRLLDLVEHHDHQDGLLPSSAEPPSANSSEEREAGKSQATIAVLPFDNLTGSTELDLIADGLVEEVLTTLAQFSELMVVARNSTAAFKGRPVDVREVASTLNVRYVVEGSVRREGREMRVVAQLIDAVTGTHLWANRFDRAIDDLFKVQEEIASSIAASIVPTLWRTEIGRMRRSSTASLDAWSLAIRAWTDYLADLTANGAQKSLPLATRAVALDPTYGFAHIVLACLSAELGALPLSSEAIDFRNRAEAHAAEALRLAEQDPLVLLGCGYIRLRFGRAGEALPLLERALTICPNHAYIRSYYGLALLLTGSTESGLAELNYAERLSPVDSVNYRLCTFRAAALFELHRDNEAMASMDRALLLKPDYNIALALKAAMLISLGREPEARLAADQAQKAAAVPFGLIAAAIQATFSQPGAAKRLIVGLQALSA
jgi:adenylate cyclase